MKEYDFKFHRVFFDKETGDFKIVRKDCNHDFRQVKFKMIDGRYQLRNQCIKCTEMTGAALSQKNVDMSKIPVSVDQLDRWELEQEEKKNLQSRLNAKRQEIRLNNLSEYYSTDEWRERREKALKRDNNICQACMENDAEEVHHLTYAHIKNEPIFDLVSICKSCHDKITQIDRENRKA